RLGETGDRPLLRELASRLIAGQLPDGGWTYQCPIIDSTQQETLWQHLQRLRAEFKADLFKPAVKEPHSSPEASAKVGKPPKPNAARKARKKRGRIAGDLKHLPALQEELEVQNDAIAPAADNSNTQFAILALWAAQRLNMPVERA